jgi:hypothetical protein
MAAWRPYWMAERNQIQ